MEDQETGSIALSCAWGPGHVHYSGTIVSDGLGLGNAVVAETTEVLDLVSGAALLEFVDGIKCICGAMILCTGSACTIVCWIRGCNEGVEDECLESAWDGKGREEEFWAGIDSPGRIVHWVAFICNIPRVERVKLCGIVDKREDASENRVDRPISTSAISPALDDSLVVSIYSEVSFWSSHPNKMLCEEFETDCLGPSNILHTIKSIPTPELASEKAAGSCNMSGLGIVRLSKGLSSRFFHQLSSAARLLTSLRGRKGLSAVRRSMASKDVRDEIWVRYVRPLGDARELESTGDNSGGMCEVREQRRYRRAKCGNVARCKAELGKVVCGRY
ncbi:hypothetical protein CY34DRAFT_18424 [Suillus luteus UH-Slu-Lm8-n1]|uniref:Unplaced genomic scaffold CY34scaffold_829, whole genome shotgun sequence n=1 Tax=Suillus luteus UH-Slu-Lm8-n1 TaxID=930992 RepID=A0A0D0AMS6_9AGAM|nr:hypothetical protein CY34DRAFT_18424 [Suillus luteus UH-Slu-Lm8-n1]